MERMDVRLEGVADDDGCVLDTVGGPGFLGLLCVVCVELEARYCAVGADGVGPDHAGVAHVHADFQD